MNVTLKGGERAAVVLVGLHAPAPRTTPVAGDDHTAKGTQIGDSM